MIPYHHGVLTCGGRLTSATGSLTSDCLHYDVLATDESPVKYPSLLQAREHPMITKVKGKPWVLAGVGAGLLMMKVSLKYVRAYIDLRM